MQSDGSIRTEIAYDSVFTIHNFYIVPIATADTIIPKSTISIRIPTNLSFYILQFTNSVYPCRITLKLMGKRCYLVRLNLANGLISKTK